jgi:putative methionine-R-sulfoxide reductase with GAF domain
MRENDSTFDEIRLALEGGGARKERFERTAEMIREAGEYRWVGIYEVANGEIAVIAWSGPGAPAYPRFPAARGLCGDAVRRSETVIVPDVTKDSRYLMTLASTRSEIVVPILDPATRRAIGTLDVESERTDAFTDRDRLLLERCAAELGRNW